jgi:hypothetical protein
MLCVGPFKNAATCWQSQSRQQHSILIIHGCSVGRFELAESTQYKRALAANREILSKTLKHKHLALAIVNDMRPSFKTSILNVGSSTRDPPLVQRGRRTHQVGSLHLGYSIIVIVDIAI